MRRKITLRFQVFTACVLLSVAISSCKKDHGNTPSKGSVGGAGFATIGLYEQAIEGNGKRLFIPVTKVGDQVINYSCIFDTGSAGLVIDADGILPASMISSSGISVSGDSVNVNGITVTSQQLTRSYGFKGNEVEEYGNLAYATITIGDKNGSISTKRIPFFLYYTEFKVETGETLPKHMSDVFGVAPGANPSFGGIKSPLNYFNLGNDFTSGFKLAKLSSAGFTPTPTYVPGLLTIGLTADDINASGFIMHPFPRGQSSNYVFGNIVYGDHNVTAATVLFDTGNAGLSLIADYAQSSEFTLPAGINVKLTTYNNYTYQYTTGSTSNVTEVASPSVIADVRTNFGIDFFVDNQFLMDYADFEMGFKN